VFQNPKADIPRETSHGGHVVFLKASRVPPPIRLVEEPCEVDVEPDHSVHGLVPDRDLYLPVGKLVEWLLSCHRSYSIKGSHPARSTLPERNRFGSHPASSRSV